MNVSEASHLDLGRAAEQAACNFLTSKDFRLVERNYRCRYGEIDLIMKDSKYLVFVEVRARKHTHYGGGIGSITSTKRHKLIKTATHYLISHQSYDKIPCRFDVIGVKPTQESWDMEWIKNAFSVDHWQ